MASECLRNLSNKSVEEISEEISEKIYRKNYLLGKYLKNCHKTFYDINMIRKLSKNDWLKWKKIRLEALEKSPNSFLSTFEEENKISDDIWERQLENSLKFGYFVDDEIVGCLGLLIENIVKISHIATLSQMYVKDNFRGSGVGVGLLDFVKDYAKKNNVRHLYLGCIAENLGAVKLYRKCGFKICGIRRDYIKINNKFYDDLIMMCEL